MLKAGEWKATSEGEELDLQQRQGASVGEGREGATIEYSPRHSELTCPPAIRKLCFPVHAPTPTLRSRARRT